MKKRFLSLDKEIKLYVLAVVTVFVLILCNQLVIQHLLAQMQADATVLNVAGRQRMLSQKINVYFYQLKEDSTPEPALHQSFEAWEMAAHELITGNAAKNIAPCTDSNTLRKLHLALQYVDFVGDRLERGQFAHQNLTEISNNQASFLLLMEDVVGDFERLSRAKVSQIVWIEIGLALFSLAVLVCEYLLVFKPSFRRIFKQQEALDEARGRKLETIAWLHSHRVRGPLARIMGLVKVLNQEAPAAKRGGAYDRELLGHLSREAQALDSAIHQVVSNAAEVNPQE